MVKEWKGRWVPGLLGSARAWFTRRWRFTTPRPSKRGLTTTALKWDSSSKRPWLSFTTW
jgi:hypothetical protein